MKVTVDIEDQFDKLVAQDLTGCYIYNSVGKDLEVAEAAKTLLKRYYLSPSEWLKWEEEYVK